MMAYTGRLCLKGIPFRGLRYMIWVRTFLVEVYERVGKSVFSVCKKAKIS